MPSFFLRPLIISHDAYLRYAFSRYSYLRYAYLRYAYLRYASLRYASLRYAILRNAFSRYAFSRYAYLRYAYLRYAYFALCYLPLSMPFCILTSCMIPETCFCPSAWVGRISDLEHRIGVLLFNFGLMHVQFG